MGNYFRSRLGSFKHAFRGIAYVIRTQKNAWVHAMATIVVILLGLGLDLPVRDWVVLMLTISMVWMAEFLNTALEAIVDLASPDQHPLARVGKDVGAAAVLISAVASVVVGLMLLGPPLWLLLIGWLER